MAQGPPLRSGGGSDGCARCFGTSARPSQWSWLPPFITAVMGGVRRTTDYGHRERPGALAEPEPQGGVVTVGYVAAPVTLERPPCLQGGDGVDMTAYSFILRELSKQEEAQKEKVASSSQRRRKKRKKMKKKAPKTSSSRCRARRLHRQWHGPGWLAGCDALRVLLPSVVVRPKMLGIMAGMDQKDNGALIVDSGSGMCKARFPGFSPHFVFLLLSAGPRPGRYVPEAQFCNWLVFYW